MNVNWPEHLVFELPLIESLLKKVSPLPGQPLSVPAAANFTKIRAFANLSGEVYLPKKSTDLILYTASGDPK